MMDPIRRRDVLKPWYVFRSAVTGRYVTRLYALVNREICVRERRWK